MVSLRFGLFEKIYIFLSFFRFVVVAVVVLVLEVIIRTTACESNLVR